MLVIGDRCHLCFVLLWSYHKLAVDSCYPFTYILQGYVTGTRVIIAPVPEKWPSRIWLRTHSRFAPSHWETVLLYKDVSHCQRHRGVAPKKANAVSHKTMTMTLTLHFGTRLGVRLTNRWVTTIEDNEVMRKWLQLPILLLLTFVYIVVKTTITQGSADMAEKSNVMNVIVWATRANFVICIPVELWAKRNGQAIMTKVVPISQWQIRIHHKWLKTMKFHTRFQHGFKIMSMKQFSGHISRRKNLREMGTALYILWSTVMLLVML